MKDSKVKPTNYITIQGWMISELKLKGNELLIYAIIYGFTQDGKNYFEGSLQYLADWTNSTKESVRKCLKSLVEKKLIVKEDVVFTGVKFCRYFACLSIDLKVDGIQQSCTGVYNKVGGGIQQSCTNNIDNNIINNIINNSNKEEVEESLYDYLEENGFVLNPIQYEEVSTWDDNDLTRYVIKETVLKNIYNVKYISTILNTYKHENIKTVEQAKVREEEYKNKTKQKSTKKTIDEVFEDLERKYGKV